MCCSDFLPHRQLVAWPSSHPACARTYWQRWRSGFHNPVSPRGAAPARREKSDLWDISPRDTLAHAGVSHAEVMYATVPDSMLKAPANEKTGPPAARVEPGARILLRPSAGDVALLRGTAGDDYVSLPGKRGGRTNSKGHKPKTDRQPRPGFLYTPCLSDPFTTTKLTCIPLHSPLHRSFSSVHFS